MMHVRGLIRRHFTEGLTDSQWQKLREHLRHCSACRAEYDRTALFMRVAAGREPTFHEMNQVQQAIFSRLDQPDTKPQAAFPRRAAARLAPAFAIVLLLTISLGVFHMRPRWEEPAQLSKGNSQSAQLSMPILEVYAIRVIGNDSKAIPRLVSEGGTIYLNEYIQFRYQMSDPRARYLYLWGVNETGQIFNYFPRSNNHYNASIVASAALKSIDYSIRLSQKHSVGPLWISAFFSHRPLNREEIPVYLNQWSKSLTLQSPIKKIQWHSDGIQLTRRFTVVKSN
jgi:hypothetical protein